ncbi:MAG TPA: ATP-binding cassette domain-containing protein [Sphaerochaeta sp.]|nr:ATP-binding cassette domain-containing protein [Sphaerochaeta sp.]
MKHEVFRLEQVSLPPYLFDINLQLYKGEIVALIGLNALGIEQLLTIFKKNIPIHYGHVYCNDILVNDYLSSSRKANRVTVIQRDTTLIDTMTVEENLFVLRKGFHSHLINQKVLSSQMSQLLAPLPIKIHRKTLVGDLTAFEKLVIEFVKASISHADLVILHEISNFVSEIDLSRLEAVMNYYKEQGMTFLYLCNHHQEAFRFCSRCYLMQEGRIIKHLFPYQMNDAVISHYSNVFDQSMDRSKRQWQYEGTQDSDQPFLVCKNLKYENVHDLTFSIHRGETVVLLDSENLCIGDLFTLFQGVAQPESGKLTLGGGPLSKDDRAISLIAPKPYETLLFPQLSVIDNLYFTSDEKIRLLWLRPKRKRAIAKELEPIFGKDLYKSSLFDLSQEKLHTVVYQRILMQHPLFVCAVQPFASVDMFQRISLIHYFDAFKKKGMTCLILAVSLSDTLQIADRLIILKGGRVERILNRSEFSQYGGIVGSIPLKSKE